MGESGYRHLCTFGGSTESCLSRAADHDRHRLVASDGRQHLYGECHLPRITFLQNACFFAYLEVVRECIDYRIDYHCLEISGSQRV